MSKEYEEFLKAYDNIDVRSLSDDWEHFLRLRADNVSGKVHPDMQIIANKIQDIINTL